MGYQNAATGRGAQKSSQNGQNGSHNPKSQSHSKKPSCQLERKAANNGYMNQDNSTNGSQKNQSFKSTSRLEELMYDNQSGSKSPHLDKAFRAIQEAQKIESKNSHTTKNYVTLGVQSPLGNNGTAYQQTFDQQVNMVMTRGATQVKNQDLSQDRSQLQDEALDGQESFDNQRSSRYRQIPLAKNRVSSLDRNTQKYVTNSDRKQSQQPMQMKNPFQQTSSNISSNTALPGYQNQQMNGYLAKAMSSTAGYQRFPYNKYQSGSKTKFIKPVLAQDNPMKTMTQKVSTEQFSLPFITKKNSINEIGDGKQLVQATIGNNGLITDSQCEKIANNWSPYPAMGGFKKADLISKTTLKHASPLIGYQNKRPIKETDPVEEETYPDQIQEVISGINNSSSYPSCYLQDQLNFTQDPSLLQDQEEIKSFNHQNSSQLNKDNSLEEDQQLRSQFNSEVAHQITIGLKKQHQQSRSHLSSQNTLGPSSRVPPSTHIGFQTYTEGEPGQDLLSKTSIGMLNHQSMDQTQQQVGKGKAKDAAVVNSEKKTGALIGTKLTTTDHLLQSNNLLLHEAKRGVGKQKQQHQDKKIRQQQTREAEIRKYFQANVNSHLHFKNTEFSTPGASSQYLDEYSIEPHSLLGTGGYAEVRLATHKTSGHKVAIKIYEKYKLIDVQVKQNLIREIKLLSRLQHPHIMRLYESIDTLSNVYLVSEYVKGQALNEYLKAQTENKMPEKEALFILNQLLSAVAYLHSKSVCHRDIKLENIIIDPETKHIKLIDFGFAVYSTKPLKLFCGTPSYMSPEILLKKEYKGAPVDVWCCGIAFYTLLVGQFPFQAHTERELQRKIQQGIYHLPRDLGRETQRLIQKMLHTDPALRSTAQELAGEVGLVNSSSRMNEASTLSTLEEATPSIQNILQSKQQIQGESGRRTHEHHLFEIHLEQRGGGKANKQSSPRQATINPKAMEHLKKLGYSELEIMDKYQEGEGHVIGQLYKRLSLLK